MKLADDMPPRKECEDKISVFWCCLPNAEIHATLSGSFFASLIATTSAPEPCRAHIFACREIASCVSHLFRSLLPFEHRALALSAFALNSRGRRTHLFTYDAFVALNFQRLAPLPLLACE
jgi:hypothetical protein